MLLFNTISMRICIIDHCIVYMLSYAVINSNNAYAVLKQSNDSVNP